MSGRWGVVSWTAACALNICTLYINVTHQDAIWSAVSGAGLMGSALMLTSELIRP